jgi:hypothetical protein
VVIGGYPSVGGGDRNSNKSRLISAVGVGWLILNEKAVLVVRVLIFSYVEVGWDRRIAQRPPDALGQS